MNGLLDVVAKVSSLYRSSPFCRKVLGDHIRGEGVGFPIVLAVLLQSWAESSEDSVSHSLMAAACGRC
jgi:hypothetical protein